MKTLRSFVWILALCGMGATAAAQQATELVLLVQLDPLNRLEANNAYLTNFDYKTEYIKIAPTDSLKLLKEIGQSTPPALTVDCFQADFKVVFQRYTYVVGTECGSVVRFKNKYPFLAGRDKENLDFTVTKDLIQFFTRLKNQYFQPFQSAHFDLATLQKIDPQTFWTPNQIAQKEKEAKAKAEQLQKIEKASTTFVAKETPAKISEPTPLPITPNVQPPTYQTEPTAQIQPIQQPVIEPVTTALAPAKAVTATVEDEDEDDEEKTLEDDLEKEEEAEDANNAEDEADKDIVEEEEYLEEPEEDLDSPAPFVNEDFELDEEEEEDDLDMEDDF